VLGTLATYIASALSIVINLITIPLALTYFGVERYGAAVIVSTLLVYLTVVGLGVPMSAGVLAALAISARGRRAVIGRCLVIVSVISVGALFAFLLALNSYDVLALLGEIPSAYAVEVRAALLVAGGFFFLYFPLGLVLSGFAAAQLVHVERVYATAITVSNLAALLATRLLGGGLELYFGLSGGLALAISVVGSVHFLLGGRNGCAGDAERPRGAPTDSVGTRLILSSSLRFLLISIASMLVWNTDNIVISHIFGMADVTAYAVTFRVITVTFTLFTGLNVALAPMYSAAHARADYQWLQEAYHRITGVVPVLGGFVWLGSLAFAQTAINVWAGPAAFGGRLMVLAIGGYGYVLSLVHSHATLMTSMNFTERAVLFAWSEGLVNLGLTIPLAWWLGPGGVALGTLIASLSTVFWLIPVEVYLRTDRRVRFRYEQVVRHFCVSLLPAVTALVVTERLSESPIARLAVGVAVLAAYLGGSWVGMPADIREFIKSRLNLRWLIAA